MKNNHQVTTERITPKDAKSYLDNKLKNRTISSSRVALYAKEMTENRWVFTAEPIRFDKDNQLMDGQHRLQAIIDSNRPQTCLVVRGLSNEAMVGIDIGQKRSVGQLFVMQAKKNPYELAGSLNLLRRYLGQGELGASSYKMMPGEAEELLLEHPDITSSVAKALRFYSMGLSTVIMGGSEPAFFHYVFSQVSPEKADEFFESLATGSNLGANSPLLILRNTLVKDRQSTKGHLIPKHRYALIIKCWNFFMQGKTVNILKWGENENFPLILGCKLKN